MISDAMISWINLYQKTANLRNSEMKTGTETKKNQNDDGERTGRRAHTHVRALRRMQFIVPDISIPVIRIVVIRRRTIIGDIAVIDVASCVVRRTKICLWVVDDVRYLSYFTKGESVPVVKSEKSGCLDWMIVNSLDHGYWTAQHAHLVVLQLAQVADTSRSRWRWEPLRACGQKSEWSSLRERWILSRNNAISMIENSGGCSYRALERRTGLCKSIEKTYVREANSVSSICSVLRSKI